MRRQFIENQWFSRVLTIILEELYEEYITLFSSEDNQILINTFITYGPPIELFMLLIDVYERIGKRTHDFYGSRITQTEHLKYIAHRIQDFFSYSNISRWKDLLAEMIQMNEINREVVWNNILAFSGSLSERIANNLREHTTPYFLNDNYLNHMMSLTFEFMSTDIYYISGHRPVQLNWKNLLKGDSVIKQLLNKVVNIGKSYIIANQYEKVIENYLPSDSSWSEKMKLLCLELSPAGLEKTLVELMRKPSMIQKSNLPESLCLVIGDCFVNSKSIQILLTSKFLGSNVFHKNIMQHWVEFIYLATRTSPKIHYKDVFLTLLELFSSKHFIEHSTYKQHKFLTKTLLYGFKYITKSDLESTLLNVLITSVQEHMSSQFPNIRKLGMVLGERFSEVLDPSHKIQFEYEEDEFDIDDDEIYEVQTQPTQLYIEQDESLDPNASFMLTPLDSPEFNFDDDLEPLSLVDHREDLQTTKSPRYLRECIVGLRSDDPETIEVTLKSLEGIIKLRPSDLDDIADILVSCLLHLEDKYELEEFHNYKINCLVALATFSVNKSVTYLTQQFYEPNYSLQQRLDILETLERASRKLSQDQIEAHENVDVIAREKQIESIKQVGVTRRWASQPKERSTRKNFFAINAGNFVFNLVGNLKTRQKNIQNMDPMLLGKLCFVLGIFVECSGILNPQLAQMTQTISEFLWTMRYHINAFVRRSVFMALNAIVKVVPGYILLTPPLVDDISEFYAWAEDQHLNDTDEECRRLALFTLMNFSQLLKDNPDYNISLGS